ncbi:MAG: hypothetical protein WCH84_09780 [Verrucomicrobiota bacterium]
MVGLWLLVLVREDVLESAAKPGAEDWRKARHCMAAGTFSQIPSGLPDK